MNRQIALTPYHIYNMRSNETEYVLQLRVGTGM